MQKKKLLTKLDTVKKKILARLAVSPIMSVLRKTTEEQVQHE